MISSSVWWPFLLICLGLETELCFGTLDLESCLADEDDMNQGLEMEGVNLLQTGRLKSIDTPQVVSSDPAADPASQVLPLNKKNEHFILASAKAELEATKWQSDLASARFVFHAVVFLAFGAAAVYVLLLQFSSAFLGQSLPQKEKCTGFAAS
mmetsp:Transcript_70897/g.125268  ORF Transcript_70897/g.125268 Transcript_70897/m.125268 type:complete len:153 (+) Transcript_70897:76-534(+)